MASAPAATKTRLRPSSQEDAARPIFLTTATQATCLGIQAASCAWSSIHPVPDGLGGGTGVGTAVAAQRDDSVPRGAVGRKALSTQRTSRRRQGAFILFFINSHSSPSGQWEEPGLQGQQILQRTECATLSSVISFAFFLKSVNCWVNSQHHEEPGFVHLGVQMMCFRNRN